MIHPMYTDILQNLCAIRNGLATTLARLEVSDINEKMYENIHWDYDACIKALDRIQHWYMECYYEDYCDDEDSCEINLPANCGWV